MPPGNTGTGAVMEKMVLHALERGGYTCERNKVVGSRFGVSKHKIDTHAEDRHGRIHLISHKWQQVSGTAEQKIPFEVMCLADLLVRNEQFYKAHLVLGGPGWHYREFYINGGLRPHLLNADRVNILSLESFISLANEGRL